jgi:hypothetical protein
LHIPVNPPPPPPPQEHFEFFFTPEVAEITARVTIRYAPKCSEKTPNVKVRSRIHHWKKIRLLAFFVNKDFTRNWLNRAFFTQKEILGPVQ